MAAKVAVLASGGGSNLQALIDHCQATGNADIGLVLANRPDAYALERARLAGIQAALIDHRAFETRGEFETVLDTHLVAFDPDWICLAGFMRVLTDDFVRRWQARLINIHPSLLPAFRGLHTHRRALEAAVRLHGCTVHLVRPELDAGPIVLQAAVPVLDGDDEARLAARVLAMEHRVYPAALDALISGRAKLSGERVLWTPPAAVLPQALMWPMAAPGSD